MPKGEHLRARDYDNRADDDETRGRVYVYAHVKRNPPGRPQLGRAQVTAGEKKATKGTQTQTTAADVRRPAREDRRKEERVCNCQRLRVRIC